MAKLTVKQLKQIIREAVRAQLVEGGLAGAVNLPRDVSASQGRRGNQDGASSDWSQQGMSLDQLVDAIKGADPHEQKQIQAAIFKIVGWKR